MTYVFSFIEEMFGSTSSGKKRTSVFGKLLILAMIASLMICLISGCSNESVENLPENEGEQGSVVDGEKEEEPEPLYDIVIKSNEELDEGYQILINNKIRYAKTDEVEAINVAESTNGNIKVSDSSIKMEERALRALEEMSAGLNAALGCDDLSIYSGYRTVEYQTTLYSNNVKNNGAAFTKRYTALPEHSEHHTGLACDLEFMRDDGSTYSLGDNPQSKWLWNNCSDYGFLLRYPGHKEPITMIAYENWHFRYMGVPHAKATEYFGLCYEEYIDMLREYTLDSRILFVAYDGEIRAPMATNLPSANGYIVYFNPMDEGETTEIRIPHGEAYDNYEISGNNVDGFIITITLDEVAED